MCIFHGYLKAWEPTNELPVRWVCIDTSHCSLIVQLGNPQPPFPHGGGCCSWDFSWCRNCADISKMHGAVKGCVQDWDSCCIPQPVPSNLHKPSPPPHELQPLSLVWPETASAHYAPDELEMRVTKTRDVAHPRLDPSPSFHHDKMHLSEEIRTPRISCLATTELLKIAPNR